jgi:hypothetical protein
MNKTTKADLRWAARQEMLDWLDRQVWRIAVKLGLA